MFDYPHWLSILAHIHLKFFVGNDRVDIYYRVANPSIWLYYMPDPGMNRVSFVTC